MLKHHVKPPSQVDFYPYLINQSLRVNDDDNAYLERTPSVAGNRKTWTWSGWVKRGNLDTTQQLFSVNNGAGTFSNIGFSSANKLQFQLGTPRRRTNRLFRDVGAWYHIVAICDTTEATGDDRLQLWVDGERETSFDEDTDPTLNADYAVNDTIAHGVGAYPTNTNHMDGYLTEINFIDGQALDPTSFGEFKNGVWVPKEYTGSYGTNGFHLDFADSGNIGNDVSGNNNDWTPVNLAASDVVLDSPTNNFCTLQKLTPTPNVLSNGNLSFSTPTATSIGYSSFGMTSGVWYWEMLSTINDRLMLGIALEGDSPNNYIGQSALSWGYYGWNGNKYNGGVQETYGDTYTVGDVIGVLFDADAGVLTFYKNNTSQGIAYSGIPSGQYFPVFGDASGSLTSAGIVNFGQDSTFAGQTTSGGNTDANGIGDFKYPVPTGALALCASNLPEPSEIDGANFFTVTLATETNTTADVATSRSGWSDYVDILKNRSSAEDWAWRFSHDSGNEYAVSTTATYQADRALSGTDQWVGYSIRIGSAYGTAAGSESHTNGVATTVTHNLGEVRGFILLFPRAGGEVFAYHPELTAGDLLYLTGTEGEFASTQITNVTANSFDIGSGAATGTYDYLILTESDLVNLTEYSGNGSTDGTFSYGFSDAWRILKRYNLGGTDWIGIDSARDEYNVSGLDLYLNSSSAEPSNTNRMDLLANGAKMRSASTASNASGSDYIVVELVKTPFKYANAR